MFTAWVWGHTLTDFGFALIILALAPQLPLVSNRWCGQRSKCHDRHRVRWMLQRFGSLAPRNRVPTSFPLRSAR